MNPVTEAVRWNELVKIGEEIEYFEYPGAEPQVCHTLTEASVICASTENNIGLRQKTHVDGTTACVWLVIYGAPIERLVPTHQCRKIGER